jgi:hypothetical protein
VCFNKVVKEWKVDVSVTKTIQLKDESAVKILYADDQVLITKSEDELHIAVID